MVARAVLWARPRCRGGDHRDRVCGAGPVGAVLHIRPGPTARGSAESCGNVSAFNVIEILLCADRPPLHMGERRRKVNDSREPRNPAENPESARGAVALPCAIRTPDRPGEGPAPPGSDGQDLSGARAAREGSGARRERGLLHEGLCAVGPGERGAAMTR